MPVGLDPGLLVEFTLEIVHAWEVGRERRIGEAVFEEKNRVRDAKLAGGAASKNGPHTLVVIRFLLEQDDGARAACQQLPRRGEPFIDAEPPFLIETDHLQWLYLPPGHY